MMTEFLVTELSFMPKVSNAADFDETSIAGLSEQLKDIISGWCGTLGGRQCDRTDCIGESERFSDLIDKAVRYRFALPGKFVTHIQSQANK
jgi:hypothetical protein